MTITAAMVKELRELTGAGVMACKNALVETDGDQEAAIEVLRKKGEATAVKKSGRIAAEGIVFTTVKDGKAAIVEVNSETDFVAKNEKFQTFVSQVANQIVDSEATDMDAFMAEPWELDTTKTVKDELVSQIAVIGENMNIRRFEKIESDGVIASYIHAGGKIGVLVNFEKGEEELAKDVCMQIAAAKPEYLSREDVPQEQVEKEMEILKVQAMNEGKPAEIAEKMVHGRIGKFYGEICLLDQEFVKDPSVKVGDLINSKGAKLVAFARLEKGEGIEKKEENFAEEVMKQIK